VADVWKRKGRKARPWVADYTDANGKRHRLSAATKEQAHALLVEKTREAREIGPTGQSSDLTVAAYVEKSWLPMIKASLAHATVKAYRYALDTHIVPAFGAMKLRDLTRAHIKWFLTEKHHAGTLSKSTIRLIRAALSSMLAEAVDDGAAIANPALAPRHSHGRKKPETVGQTDVDPERSLNEAEVSALLNAAVGQEARVLLTLLVRGGLRPGEAIALQWTDLNFTKREILVERNFYDGVLGTTKSGRRRHVDMSQQLAAALSELYVQREREKLEGKWTRIPDWIFCQHGGEPLRQEHVRDKFDRALRRAGLSGHVPYDLRHTFASTLLAKGAPLTYVAKQMGHKKPTITLQYYAHWIPSGDKSFVDSLDEPRPELSFGTTFGTTLRKVSHPHGTLAESDLNVC
jgi:integrase